MVLHIIDFCAFMVVLTLTGVLIPQILLIAFRKNLFDTPDERKIHTLPIPRLGGLAFLPTIFLTILLVFGIGMTTGGGWMGEYLSQQTVTQALYLGCGMMALYIVGVADDLIGVRYSAKFVVQVIAAAMLVTSGLVIDDLHGLFGIHTMPFWVAAIFTVVIIVGVTNAINLIDGIDGLASGLSAIACLLYGFMAQRTGIHFFGLLVFCTLGALASFFLYNVFGDARKHKKIFMGDTGALTIGIILSAIAIKICGETENAYDYNPAVMAFAPLLVPCLDVVRVYFFRIRKHRNPFLPDKNHIHHKLLAAGFPQRVAMIVIVTFSAALSYANICASPYVNITILFLADIIIWSAINIILARRIEARKRSGHLEA